MQKNPKYDSLMDTLESYFEKRISLALKYNIKLENIIIDPGIGFGKRVCDNDQIIQNISRLKIFSSPILLGISRKKYIKELSSNNDSSLRLGGTISSSIFAMMQGVQILRVHDVNEISQSLKVFKSIKYK